MDLPESQGLTLKESAKLWPCSPSTMADMWRKGVIATTPLKPGSPYRRTTVGDLKAARERLRLAEAGETVPDEDFDDAVARYEREGA